MSFSIDRRAELRMLAAYTPREVARILTAAAKAGGDAGAPIMRSAAPIGRAKLSSRYVAAGLGHGHFRSTVRAAPVRRLGRHDETAQVVGPMGAFAYTRGWIEARTGWGSKVAGRVATAMRAASDRVLDQYARARR